ncbi:MAG: 30S ribosome-binding factor RbfA [Bacteroidota bacterium]|nr:30S ribosome-binding factor RbfA [Bacteroidota bacterium]
MSTRTEKFNREMQRELGTIFQTKTNDWFGGALVTVTEVSSSPDLSYVKAYLSILGAKDHAFIMNIVETNNKLIRKELANKIKNAVRIIPEIQFFEDNSLEKVEKFEKIFDDLRKERESRENK